MLLGELMRIVVEEYVQHLSGYHFQLLWECDILHDQIQHINRIHYEFNALYHWHQLVLVLYSTLLLIDSGVAGKLASPSHPHFSTCRSQTSTL